ncbi:alpha/beta fold hydrolase [Afipia sp. GAS231]|uniref:alpha/beta fold hydrolase n=1 Tax=Afipia sp. GAS231 TaxID=1882747 RepID=UPI00087AB2BB|nr:alpha/beta fold hydrolase [Afipia sp. GAS231]SDO68603.1 polyhydroxyalkanoate synthase [Afipia sp. GAS231]
MNRVGEGEGGIAQRFQSEIEKAIQRNIKGLEYFASPAPAVGLTPKNVIYKRGTLNLYHYRPVTNDVYRVPLLLVMATTNKAYVFDLAPGQSLIEFLLRQGYDVYVIDWDPPRPEEKRLRLEDYVLDFIPDCIKRVQSRSQTEDVTLIGYCMGGVLSVIYASLHPNGPIKNLACFTTPINWEPMKLVQNWTDRRYFDVDRLVDTLGIIPSDVVAAGFDMQRPTQKIAGTLRLWDNMWNDQFVKSYRMFDRWGSDTLPLAGEYFRQVTKELLWENRLVKGTLELRGQRVDLSAIKVPLLHVVAEHDHIVPYDCAKELMFKVGSEDKEEVILKGGHVSLVAGPNAVKRMWPKLDQWLGERST